MPANPAQVVLMYRSGEETSDKALSAFKDAETRVKAAAAPEMNQLQFFVSDAAKDRNGDQMEQKVGYGPWSQHCWCGRSRSFA
jgi:hypothetical protein